MRRKLRNRNSIDGRWLNSRWLARHGLLIIVMIALMTSCSSNEVASGETYTCPMHPTVVADKPGSCPVCGMDLVRKTQAGEEVAITKELSQLIKSPNKIVTASIKTVRGEYKSVPVVKELLGIVTYDTRSMYTIPTRIGGRLEKVFLKYNFQLVTKGMKIAEVYSPELISAQRELLFLILNDADNKALIEGAIRRLKFLGATERQVADLMKDQQVYNTFSIYSPYDGYVTMNDQSPTLPADATVTTKKSSMGMNAEVSASQPTRDNISSASLPREGSYVSAGQVLFKIVNASATWIEFQLSSTDAEYIKKGDEIVLAVENESEKVRVDFVEPFSEQSNDFVTIRSYTRNSKLLIGQLIKGAITVNNKSSLWLPKAAVLDLGIDQIVFIKEKDQFRPIKVKSGLRGEDLIQIISGITSGDEVAIDAHYLVDSEGFVKLTN